MYQCVKKGQSLQPVRVMLYPRGAMAYPSGLQLGTHIPAVHENDPGTLGGMGG